MARGIPSEVIRHFKAVPLFSGVSNKSLRTIVQSADELDVSSGKILVREGGTDRELFVILRGEAAVTRGGRKLSTLGPGDFFGEMALLSRGERTATVTARTDMRVMLVGPRHLEDVLAREPSVAQPMLEVMARRIRSSERANY